MPALDAGIFLSVVMLLGGPWLRGEAQRRRVNDRCGSCVGFSSIGNLLAQSEPRPYWKPDGQQMGKLQGCVEDRHWRFLSDVVYLSVEWQLRSRAVRHM